MDAPDGMFRLRAARPHRYSVSPGWIAAHCVAFSLLHDGHAVL